MVYQKLMWIAWPSFLAACVLELVVFAFVDPSQLDFSGQSLEMSRQAAYTAAFFTFWAVIMFACSMTTLLRMTPAEVNGCPFGPDERPDACVQAPR